MAGKPLTAATTPPNTGGRLTIDLGALADNWRMLAARATPAETASVVKADAYGLGTEPVAQTLAAAGCRTFFVAFPEEGITLRTILPAARIFVLNGRFGDGASEDYLAHDLIPCLNSVEDVEAWRAAGDRPWALAVDTGMNRLGVSMQEAEALAASARPTLVLSHLAVADEPQHPMNAAQLEATARLQAFFGDIPVSLANSAGVFLGEPAHRALTRPGIALFGGAPQNGVANPMRTVVTAEARITQIRHAGAGETVSYGATQRLERDTLIAVCAVGYADGYHRALSGAGVPLRRAVQAGGVGFIAGRRVPLLGRVTMDAIMFDVTDCEGAVTRGDWIELFGPNLPIDEVAAAAGTISYELLTSLGRRWHRIYRGGQEQGTHSHG